MHKAYAMRDKNLRMLMKYALCFMLKEDTNIIFEIITLDDNNGKTIKEFDS